MAALIARSLEVDELVVAGIAEMAVQPDPLGGVEERFGGERPALEVELLELVSVALDHDVFLLTDALDLLDRGFQLEQAQVVQRAERDHQVELLVAPRIRILRAI